MAYPQANIPEFGERAPDKIYVPRPGAYGLIFDVEGRIAAMETPRGCFLPGGGTEEGETPEETLVREVREECGFRINVGRRLGEAAEYRDTPGHDYAIRKDCVFFAAQVTSTGGAATEADHTLIWLQPQEAEMRLAHGSQQWAVRQYRQADECGLSRIWRGGVERGKMFRPRACCALIQNEAILMVRHAEPTRSYWTLPGGGVEAGETLSEAAEREMAEETGLRVRAVRLLWEGVYGHGGRTSPEYCFLVALEEWGHDAPALGHDPEEAHLPAASRLLQGVAWVPLAEIAGDPQVARVLRALAE